MLSISTRLQHRAGSRTALSLCCATVSSIAYLDQACELFLALDDNYRIFSFNGYESSRGHRQQEA